MIYKAIVPSILLFLSALVVGGCSSEDREKERALHRLRHCTERGAFAEAIALADSMDQVWSTELSLRQEVLALRRTALQQKHLFLIDSTEYALLEVNRALDSMDKKMLFLPENSTRSAKYTAPQQQSAPTMAGYYLYASCDAKGFLTLVHYYIGKRPMPCDALQVSNSLGAKATTSPLPADKAHNHSFSTGGLHYTTLQLPPNDSQLIALFLQESAAQRAEVTIQLTNKNRTIHSYRLSSALRDPLLQTIHFAELIRKRDTLREQLHRHQRAVLLLKKKQERPQG